MKRLHPGDIGIIRERLVKVLDARASIVKVWSLSPRSELYPLCAPYEIERVIVTFGGLVET